MGKQKLTPEKKLGPLGQYRYGFVDEAGNWIIKPVFENVKPFHNGVAFVEDDRCLWGVIDIDGNWVVKPTFSHVSEFVDGLAVAKNRIDDSEMSGKVGYIDSEGRWVIPPRFYKAEPFHDGIAKVMERPGQEWKPIDKRGNEIIKATPGDFEASLKVETAEYEGQINARGGWIVGPFFKMPRISPVARSEDIIMQGDCRHEEQTGDNTSRMNFTLTAGGVLTITGNDWLNGVSDCEIAPVTELSGEEDAVLFRQSQFKNLDFNTAIIEDGVKGLSDGCFSGCRNIKNIVLKTDSIVIMGGALPDLITILTK